MLLVDFDGTITSQDSELYIAKQILDASRRAQLAEMVSAYEHLEIGISEYYGGYFSLTALSKPEWQELAQRVPWREDFSAFVARCAQKNIDIMILSEGLDLFIKPLLDKLGVQNLPLSCNRLIWQDGHPQVLPAHDAQPCSRCLNCKGAHVRRFMAQGKRVGVIGNGASDLCAARETNLVFARDHLARLCQIEGIPFTPWQTFADVDERMVRL